MMLMMTTTMMTMMPLTIKINRHDDEKEKEKMGVLIMSLPMIMVKVMTMLKIMIFHAETFHWIEDGRSSGWVLTDKLLKWGLNLFSVKSTWKQLDYIHRDFKRSKSICIWKALASFQVLFFAFMKTDLTFLKMYLLVNLSPDIVKVCEFHSLPPSPLLVLDHIVLYLPR